MMKSWLKVLVATLVIASLVSCSPVNPNSGKSVDAAKSTGDVAAATSAAVAATTVAVEDTTAAVEATETPKATEAPATVSISEQVLYDKDKIKITAKSLALDGLMGPTIKLLIENDSDKNITVQTSTAAVNGYMVGTVQSTDVVAGKKANDEITFLSTDLEASGITVFKDIDLAFRILESENYHMIADTDLVHIQTTADPSYVQPVDDSGFVALDKNDVKVVVKKLNDTTSFWGADLYVYVENNTEKDVTVQVRDVSLNGFMMNPAFSCQVLPAKKAISSITFLDDELKSNDITKFESLELTFNVSDTKTYKTIFESKGVKVTFEN